MDILRIQSLSWMTPEEVEARKKSIPRIVASLDSSDLARETHQALKNKLGIPKLVNSEGTLEDVKVTFSRPEEWLYTRITPSINLNIMSSKFDPGRFTTERLDAYKDETYGIVLEKRYPIPVNYIYEIRFIVSYGQHMMSLNDQILRKFPPFGFNTFVKIPFGDGNITCPFELVDEKEVFNRFGKSEENREFERVYRFKVESWLDLDETHEYKTIYDVLIDWQTIDC